MKNTLLFILKSLVRALSLLVAVSIVAFILVTVSPINPLQANVGQTALGSMSAEQIEKLEEYYGVNTPPLERYLNWAGDFIRGDMGTSLVYRQSVAEVISQRLNNSLWLLIFAWAASGLIGFALGVSSGTRADKPLDKGIRSFALITASTPPFWLALILLMVFSVWLQWFPVGLSVPIGLAAGEVSFADRLAHAVLPALALSLSGIASVTLHTREKTFAVMESDYVLFAAARGESRRSIILRHGLRNVAIPALTLQFASVGEIIGSSVLVEQVFSYPGLGQAAVAAGLNGDVPLLLGISLICAALVIGGNFIANVLHGVIDPRIRRSQ